MLIILFILIMAFHCLLWLLFINLIYFRNKKSKTDLDYRKKVLLSVAFSNFIGFIVFVFFGNYRIFISNSFDSYFYPLLSFFISDVLTLCLLYFAVFQKQKGYLKEALKITLSCSPYIMFIPILNNILVSFGVYHGIH